MGALDDDSVPLVEKEEPRVKPRRWIVIEPLLVLYIGAGFPMMSVISQFMVIKVSFILKMYSVPIHVGYPLLILRYFSHFVEVNREISFLSNYNATLMYDVSSIDRWNMNWWGSAIETTRILWPYWIAWSRDHMETLPALLPLYTGMSYHVSTHI